MEVCTQNFWMCFNMKCLTLNINPIYMVFVFPIYMVYSFKQAAKLFLVLK